MKIRTFPKTLIVMMLTIATMVSATASISPLNKVTTVTYKTEEFKNLVIDGAFEVNLYYGLHAEVSITTEQSAQEKVLIDNDGNTLFIRTKEDKQDYSKIILNVTVNNLEQMNFKDVTLIKSINFLWFNNVNIDINTHGKAEFNMTAKKLNINLEGAGDVYLSGQIDELNIQNHGIGSFYTEELKSEKLNIKQSSKQNMELRLSNKNIYEVKPAHSKTINPKA
jgi:hypothetical protein